MLLKDCRRPNKTSECEDVGVSLFLFMLAGGIIDGSNRTSSGL